jgi:hypothetical protein
VDAHFYLFNYGSNKNLERGFKKKTGYVFSPAVQQLQHGLSIVNLTNGQQNERHTHKNGKVPFFKSCV